MIVSVLCVLPGPLCSICSPGYFLASTTQQCEPCGQDDRSAWIDPVILGLACLLFLALMYAAYNFNLWLRDHEAKTVDEAILLVVLRCCSLDASRFNTSQRSLNSFVREKKRYCQISLKIYLTFYQIVSQLPEVLGLQFPQAYNFLVAPLDILNLSFLTNFTFVDCASGTGYDYIDRLYVSTLYPAALFIVLRCMQEVHLFVNFKWERSQRAQVLSAKYFRAMLFGLNLVLPALSVKILRMFSCSDLDPEDSTPEDNSYLTADMSISCSSERYKTAKTYAIFCTLVYPVGVPCMYLLLLMRRRDDIMRRDEPAGSAEEEKARDTRLEPLQGLFYAFKHQFW